MGLGLNTIPADAIGIHSGNNDNPLQYRYDREPYRVYTITEQSAESLTLVPQEVVTLGADVYLSAIVSPDGEIVYWQNDTRPLP